jgi:hypothetical protein
MPTNLPRRDHLQQSIFPYFGLAAVILGSIFAAALTALAGLDDPWASIVFPP